MQQILHVLNKSFGVYKIKGIYVEPTLWQALAIILCVFLLVFTLARVRFLYVHWSMGKQNLSFLFWGFVMALIIEAIMIISGRTLFTEVIGWKNVPKPISTILDISRNKMISVMGVNSEVPSSLAEEPLNAGNLFSQYQLLTPSEMENFRVMVCK